MANASPDDSTMANASPDDSTMANAPPYGSTMANAPPDDSTIKKPSLLSLPPELITGIFNEQSTVADVLNLSQACRLTRQIYVVNERAIIQSVGHHTIEAYEDALKFGKCPLHLPSSFSTFLFINLHIINLHTFTNMVFP